MIPKDPVILLSYVNTQLRDYYDSLEALCTCRGLKKQELVEKLRTIDYELSLIHISRYASRSPFTSESHGISTGEALWRTITVFGCT